MKKICNILKWYQDEPWHRIFTDCWLGIKVGSSLGFQLAKEEWKDKKNRRWLWRFLP